MSKITVDFSLDPVIIGDPGCSPLFLWFLFLNFGLWLVLDDDFEMPRTGQCLLLDRLQLTFFRLHLLADTDPTLAVKHLVAHLDDSADELLRICTITPAQSLADVFLGHMTLHPFKKIKK